MQENKSIKQKTLIYLDEDEARIFLMLRRIAMHSGSIKLNYDDKGIVQSMDEFKHHDGLSTVAIHTLLTN